MYLVSSKEVLMIAPTENRAMNKVQLS